MRVWNPHCLRRGKNSVAHATPLAFWVRMMRSRIWFIVFLVAVGCQAKPDGSANAHIAVLRLDAVGLHNVFRVSDRIYSGSIPDEGAAFAALQKLGIQTILSVDGAKPDADAARRHGLRYVHLPFGYDSIPRERVLELVKAATDLPGPIYIHCHHGKHRGPAAVAAIQLCTDPAWDADRAEAWFRMAETDPRYTGLTAIARSLIRPTAEELARVPSDFPAAAPVPDLARLMVNVDQCWDHLKRVKAAGWSAPPNHPDIDPAHEAMQLIEHYREATRLTSVKNRGPAFATLLAEAESAATALEAGLRDKDGVRATEAFARSATACATCHETYRDYPKQK